MTVSTSDCVLLSTSTTARWALEASRARADPVDATLRMSAAVLEVSEFCFIAHVAICCTSVKRSRKDFMEPGSTSVMSNSSSTSWSCSLRHLSKSRLGILAREGMCCGWAMVVVQGGIIERDRLLDVLPLLDISKIDNNRKIRISA